MIKATLGIKWIKNTKLLNGAWYVKLSNGMGYQIFKQMNDVIQFVLLER